MAALDVLPYVTAGLLMAAGAAKVRDPATMADATRALGIASPAAPVWVGASEITLGSLGLLVGGRYVWASVTAVYLAFAGVIAYLHRTGNRVSCGCFGQRSTPIGPQQVVANLLTAALAAFGAITNTPGLLSGSRTSTASAALAGGVAVGVPVLRRLHTGPAA